MTNPSVPERNFNIVVITGGLLEAHPAYTAVELEQLPARQMRFWVQGHEILAAHLVGHLAQAGPHCTDAATDPGGVRSIWRVAGGQVRDRSGASRDSRAGVLGPPSRRRHEAAFEPGTTHRRRTGRQAHLSDYLYRCHVSTPHPTG